MKWSRLMYPAVLFYDIFQLMKLTVGYLPLCRYRGPVCYTVHLNKCVFVQDHTSERVSGCELRVSGCESAGERVRECG